MRIFLMCVSIFTSLSTGVFATNSNPTEVKIRVIETSDVHGHFFPFDFINRKPSSGSLSRVSSYVKEQRELHGDNCLLLDNGDILQGQPSVYYYNFIDTLSTHLTADVMNYMGYDASNIGNHDIEPGAGVYNRWVEQCNFPVLGANAVYKGTTNPYFKPYTVFTKSGVKIAVLGLITPAVPCWLPEQLWQGMEFAAMSERAAHWVNVINETEKPDFLIGLFHAGKSGSMIGSIEENPSLDVAKNIPGFDAVLIGHDHVVANMKITNTDGKQVLLLNPGSNSDLVSTLLLTATVKEGKVIRKNVVAENVDMNKYPVDAAYMQKFENQYNASMNFISRKIGAITETISTRESYFGSSAFIDLIHKLQLEISGAEISLTAPLSADAKIAKGDILISDMFNLYKYENMLYVMSLTGKEIKGLLEMSYSLWINQMQSPDDNLLLFRKPVQPGKANRLVNPCFNFDSAAGINYTVNVTKPAGERVTILSMSNGESFDANKHYKVAVNSYRGNGGGDLLTKGAGIPNAELTERLVWASDKDLRYYLIQYIVNHGTIEPFKFNNWCFTPEEWVKPAIEKDSKLLFGQEAR